MFRRFSTNFAVFSIFLDGLLIALSLYLSIILREWSNALPYCARPAEAGNSAGAVSSLPAGVGVRIYWCSTSMTGARTSAWWMNSEA